MSIDDISGKVSSFWARAKATLASSRSETPAPTPDSTPASPKPAGDTAKLAHKHQYFAGYAMPEADAAAPQEPAASDSGEAKVWAPLVIAPFEPPGDPPRDA